MTFPAYRNYRESGLNWLASMPEHWEAGRLRWVATRYAGGTPDKNRLDYWVSGNIPWLNSGSVNQDLITEASALITNEGFANSSARWVPCGALVMALAGQGKTKGMVAQLGIAATCNQSMAAIVPGERIQARFLLWWLRANYQNIRNMSGGDNREGLNLELLGEIHCPLPPEHEQRSIAGFLDQETAKIDALVEEQRRLITLLKEKRQAVISRAVTKGLNPDASMKDSGIEWLGEVPAHWTVTKFSRAVDFQEGPGIMAADFRDEGVPLIRVAGASGRWASLDGCNYLHPEKVAVRWNHFRLELGDLIISGSASFGTVCEVGPEVVGAIAYTGLIRLRPVESETTRDFLRAFVNSSAFFTQIELLKAGATIQHFGPTHLRQMLIPAPPLTEQIAIAGHIDRVNAFFDELIGEAELAIALLNERRSALISAAVTGKIDVRGASQVLPFSVDRIRARGLIATEIIERSARQANFGRVKLQKIAYLAEAHVGVSELEGTYLREAAGPLDREMVRDMEREAGRLAGIRADQTEGAGTAVSYRVGDQRGTHRVELTTFLGADRSAKLDKLIDDIATIDTKGAEAVATLYAVWNDALIEGDAPTDSENVLAVLTEWHPEKKQKFRMGELHTWLGWMRRHGLVPRGSGPKTSTGRLFT